MYKRDKWKLRIICFGVFMVLYCANITIKDIDNITITIASIILGFNISALSALSGKTCISELSKKQDEEDRSKTQLGVLKTYFSKSFSTGVNTIIYVLFKNILISKNFFITQNIFQTICLWLQSNVDICSILNRMMIPLEVTFLAADFILMKKIFDLLLIYFYRE